jgi:hypothetical protein
MFASCRNRVVCVLQRVKIPFAPCLVIKDAKIDSTNPLTVASDQHKHMLGVFNVRTRQLFSESGARVQGVPLDEHTTNAATPAYRRQSIGTTNRTICRSGRRIFYTAKISTGGVSLRTQWTKRAHKTP